MGVLAFAGGRRRKPVCRARSWCKTTCRLQRSVYRTTYHHGQCVPRATPMPATKPGAHAYTTADSSPTGVGVKPSNSSGRSPLEGQLVIA